MKQTISNIIRWLDDHPYWSFITYTFLIVVGLALTIGIIWGLFILFKAAPKIIQIILETIGMVFVAGSLSYFLWWMFNPDY